MLWPTRRAHNVVGRSFRRSRQVGVAVLIGLALTVAACGTTTGGVGQPTPTPKPSAPIPPTPVSCTGWHIVASPNTKYPNGGLYSASALSPTDAWAVGSTYTEGESTTQGESLIERWDGSAWHIVASGNTIPGGLTAITAISPTNVWAVGEQSDAGAHSGAPLITHWDGTTWSVVTSPSPHGAWSAWLDSVTAITAKDVWAFGGLYASAPDQQAPQVLVEHWDGASWQIVSSPPLPSGTSRNGGAILSATRIPGTNQLWAIGEWHQWLGLGRGQPLIERWDGNIWQIVPSPSLPSGALGGGWSGVVALSASNAWAVGSYALNNPQGSHPLIAHWDGTSWQDVVADPSTYGTLDSVVAGRATDVRAAGSQLTGPGASSGNGQRVPLIEQWNGTIWQVVTTPQPPSGLLSGSLSIATDGVGNYWAVGSYLNAENVTQTLTMHCP